MGTSLKIRAASVPAVTVLILLAGCGGGATDQPAFTATPTTTPTPTTQESSSQHNADFLADISVRRPDLNAPAFAAVGRGWCTGLNTNKPLIEIDAISHGSYKLTVDDAAYALFSAVKNLCPEKLPLLQAAAH
jgi:hypothetical protein